MARKVALRMAVPVEVEPRFQRDTPRTLFSGDAVGMPRILGFDSPRYDVAPDGQRFVVVQQVQQTQERAQLPTITVIENWHAEFKDRHP